MMCYCLQWQAQEDAADEDATAYESTLLSVSLVVVNAGVLLIGTYQVYLTFKKPPPMAVLKLQRKLCCKVQ